jgi:hypothetical protein
MMKKNIGMAMVCLLLAAAGLLAIAGCESNDPSGSINVTPASATITAANGTQVFVASAASSNAVLQLPLVWTVSDPTKGSIVSSGGLSAVYQRNGGATGGNAITVRDQAQIEGVAAVTQ